MMWKIKYQCHISHWSPSHSPAVILATLWPDLNCQAPVSWSEPGHQSLSLCLTPTPLHSTFLLDTLYIQTMGIASQLFIILASHNPTLVHTNYENCISHSLLKTLHLFYFLPLWRHHVCEYNTVSRTIIWLFIIKLYCHSIIVTVSCLDPECNWFLIQELNFYHLG